jgi:hypothetical protein
MIRSEEIIKEAQNSYVSYKRGVLSLSGIVTIRELHLRGISGHSRISLNGLSPEQMRTMAECLVEMAGVIEELEGNA